MTRRLFIDHYRDAVHASDLQPLERLLLLTMARYATYETGRDCRPGAETLAAQTGISVRHVKRLRAGLEGSWLHRVSSGGRTGTKRASEYHLTIPTSDTTSPVKLSTGDTVSPVDQGHHVTGHPPTSDTGDTTRDTMSPVPVTPCHPTFSIPPMTTAPRTISEQHQAVAANGLAEIRSIVRRQPEPEDP
jgi:hypothetical protein